MNRPDRAFLPTASLHAIRRRAEVLRSLRSFFDGKDFVEVQTPVLGAETVVDAHLDPLVIPGTSIGTSHFEHEQAFLQTSPELLMKRLLAAGMERIYQIGPVFRAGEAGERHNPEFTMAEWYRVGDDLSAGVGLLDELMHSVAGTPRALVLTYQQAFKELVGIDPFADSSDAIRRRAAELQVTIPLGSDRDGCLECLFGEAIEPNFEALGQGRPVIVTHFPISQAALAQASPEDPQKAERFELYWRGVELANGYGELRDATTLRARIIEQNRLRVRRGAPSLPTPDRLLEAMEFGFPPCSGCAVGVDRLLMVLLDTRSIADVQVFPLHRL